VSLEPILKPGFVLAVGANGAVEIVAAGSGDPKRASFQRGVGLAGKGVSFAGLSGGHLRHRDGVVIVGGGDKGAATFVVS
uniref:hypothetical protein n=1 Tax=uncultured Caulobacter sp. TaxID=158749 RepID=UPI0025EAB764